MKKATLLLAGIVLSASLMAQTPAENQKKKAEMNDLKKDIHEKRAERSEMGKEFTHGRIKKGLEKRKEVRAEKRDIKADKERLESQGVKHPVEKAKHKIKAEKEEKKANIHNNN